MRKSFIPFIIILISAVSVYAQRGRVQIQNGTVVTDKGTLLRGAIDHFFWEDISYEKERQAITGIKELGLNCIHMFAEGPESGEPGSSMEAIDSVVKWTREDSLYMILTPTWHDQGEPDINFIRNYWRIYADRYKDETHVIFEICNEPSNLPYDSISLEMERNAYDTIREYAPETHILLMCPYTFRYDSILSDIAKLGNGIDWGNASISGHAYQYPAQDFIEPIQMIKDAGYAITVTEFKAFEHTYANLALTRVFEQDSVSYVHFISSDHMVYNPPVFKSRIEAGELRWNPDFGNWPVNLSEINYASPYNFWKAGYYDEGSGWEQELNDYNIAFIGNNDYVAYYNIDFDEGPETFEVFGSSDHGEGNIELHLDSISGPIVGICAISNTDAWHIYESFNCNITTGFAGIHDIYMVFKETNGYPLFNVRAWYFGKSGSQVPQTPYNGAACALPGKIEAEEYDFGGPTISFLDMDTVNQGSLFRQDEVDIDTTDDGGYCIGWTEKNEWMEYTVSCEQATTMDIQLRVACIDTADKFNIKLDNNILATAHIISTGGYHNWEIITIEDIPIPAGENQILRLELLDGNFNLDWMNFVEHVLSAINRQKEVSPIKIYPNPARDYFTVQSTERANLEIYSMQGQLLQTLYIEQGENQIAVGNLIPGNYLVKIFGQDSIYTELISIQ